MESLLTGESDPVIKEVGSTLYSGSSVISGKACAEVIHVGNDNYATSLVNEVKKEKAGTVRAIRLYEKGYKIYK